MNGDHQPDAPRGKLQVIIGPMFSGKTSELIRRVLRYHMAGYRCIVISHTREKVYNESKVITHDGHSLDSVSTPSLTDVSHIAVKHDVVGIDGGQNFTDIAEFCQRQSDSGKKVVVGALDGDASKEPYHHVLELIPLAEEVVKLNSICMSCASDAPFTKRIGPVTENKTTEAKDKYMSVCGDCYREESLTTRSPFKTLKTPSKIIPVVLF